MMQKCKKEMLNLFSCFVGKIIAECDYLNYSWACAELASPSRTVSIWVQYVISFSTSCLFPQLGQTLVRCVKALSQRAIFFRQLGDNQLHCMLKEHTLAAQENLVAVHFYPEKKKLMRKLKCEWIFYSGDFFFSFFLLPAWSWLPVNYLVRHGL